MMHQQAKSNLLRGNAAVLWPLFLFILTVIVSVWAGCRQYVAAQAPPPQPERLRITYFHSPAIQFSGPYKELGEFTANADFSDPVTADCRVVGWHPWFGTDNSAMEINLLSWWSNGVPVGTNVEWDKHLGITEHGEKEIYANFPDPGLGGVPPIIGKFYGFCITPTGCGAAVTAIYYWRCPN